VAELRVTDHALLRYLQRQEGLDVEGLRATLQDKLERAAQAAKTMQQSYYTVKLDGIQYLVRDQHVVTVLEKGMPQYDW
jgi:hypothetical protein